MYALPAIYKKFLLHFSCQGKCQNLPVSHAYFFAQNHNTLLLFLFLRLRLQKACPAPCQSRACKRHRNACSAQVSTYRYAVHTGIYVTSACCGFSFNLHPLSMQVSAYKRKCRPCKQKLKTACRWYCYRLPLECCCLLFRFKVQFPRICCTNRTNYDLNATYLEGTFVQTFAPAFAFPVLPSVIGATGLAPLPSSLGCEPPAVGIATACNWLPPAVVGNLCPLCTLPANVRF